MITRFLRAWWPAWIGSVLFVTAAISLIPYPRPQEDKLIFSLLVLVCAFGGWS